MSEQNIQLLATRAGAGVLLFNTHYTQVGDFKTFFVVVSNEKHNGLKLEIPNAHQKKRISQLHVLSIVLSYLLWHPFHVGGDVCLHG